MTLLAVFGSEARRLLARRAVRWGTAIALGIVVLMVAVSTIRSTGTGPTDHTMRLNQLWLERPGGTDGNLLGVISTYVYVLIVGIAATAVGGDYRAGTIGTLLTWEPRRVRVAGARIGAIVSVSIVLFLLIIGVLVGGWSLGATWRGSTANLRSDFWLNLVAVIARGTLVAAVLSVITAGIAFVTRGTVGAVMSWFGYLIGIEAILASRVPSLRPSLLLSNLGAFFQGADVPERSGFSFLPGHIAQPGPGLLRGVTIAMVVAGLGVLAFSRRDVT